MILGVGTDIVSVTRIAEAVSRNGDALARRILTDNELALYRSAANPTAYLAKRFAAKEAVAKALGTGIGQISWRDLEVANNARGAPEMVLHGTARLMLADMGATRVDISIADERDSALAFAVISG